MEKLCPLRPWTEGTRLIPWLGGFNLFPKRGKYFLFRTHEDKKFKMICVFYWRWRNQQNPIQRFSQLRVGSLWRCTKNCGGAKTCGGAKKNCGGVGTGQKQPFFKHSSLLWSMMNGDDRDDHGLIMNYDQHQETCDLQSDQKIVGKVATFFWLLFPIGCRPFSTFSSQLNLFDEFVSDF